MNILAMLLALPCAGSAILLTGERRLKKTWLWGCVAIIVLELALLGTLSAPRLMAYYASRW